jgi:hypothetical protein
VRSEGPPAERSYICVGESILCGGRCGSSQRTMGFPDMGRGHQVGWSRWGAVGAPIQSCTGVGGRGVWARLRKRTMPAAHPVEPTGTVKASA